MAATKDDIKAPASAAEQAAAQKAVQEGAAPADADKDAKSNVTASDAEKEANVAAGGFDGQGIPPGPSGAIMEQEIRTGQQMDHPAVDSQPRKGVPGTATRIDFNDPTI